MILVTGGAGFVGNFLCKKLLSENLQVICVDNLVLGRKDYVKDLMDNENFLFEEVDLSDSGKVKALFQKYSINKIYHLAANSDISKGIKDIRLDFKANFVTTLNLLENSKDANLDSFIFSSTSAIFGDAPSNINEDFGPLKPESYYGASKLCSEAYISAFSTLNQLKSFIFRFPNVIGPKLTHGVIFDFINKLKSDSTNLEILGDGKQMKPYIYIDDLLSGMDMVEKKSEELMNVYNIGPEGQTTVTEIANIVVKEMNLLEVNFNYTGGKQGWPGDVPRFSYDSSKIRQLGWHSKYSSNEAVSKTVKELIKN